MLWWEMSQLLVIQMESGQKCLITVVSEIILILWKLLLTFFGRQIKLSITV